VVQQRNSFSKKAVSLEFELVELETRVRIPAKALKQKVQRLACSANGFKADDFFY